MFCTQQFHAGSVVECLAKQPKLVERARQTIGTQLQRGGGCGRLQYQSLQHNSRSVVTTGDNSSKQCSRSSLPLAFSESSVGAASRMLSTTLDVQAVLSAPSTFGLSAVLLLCRLHTAALLWSPSRKFECVAVVACRLSATLAHR